MSATFTIGIDLGGTNLKVALFDHHYACRAKKILNTREFKGRELLLRAIIKAVQGLCQSRKVKRSSLLGVGIGVPGPVDYAKGQVHFLPNVPGWKNVPLKKILEKALRVPVFVDNDAKVMGLAECQCGAARTYASALCITLGTGVGGAILLEGNIYRGASNASGEIGHLPVNVAGPACNCGGSACLESYIGNDRILAYAKILFKRPITLEELSTLAKKKDVRALRIWSMVGEYLGIALAGAVNLLNLECIVIGGGVANAGKFLFEVVAKTVKRRAMAVQAKDVRIFKAKLGSDAGLIGAAIMVEKNCRKGAHR